MRSSHRVARNTALLSVGLMVMRLLGFLVFRRLTGIEGAAGTGVWGVAAELSAILTIAACFGLNALLIRETIKLPEQTWNLFWASLRIRMLAGGLGYAILAAFVTIADYDQVARIAVLAMACGVFLEAAAMNCDAVLQAREEIRHQTISQIIGGLAYFGLAWLWLDQGHGLMGVVWASVTSRGVRLAVVMALVVPRIRPKRTAAPADPGIMRRMVKMAWPVFLATVLGVATLKIDTVMLMSLAGKVETGIYTAGRKPLELLMLLPQLFAVALFPALQRARTAAAPGSLAELQQMGERAHRYLLALVLLLTLGCFVAARPVIGLLAPGEAFAQSAQVLRIVLLGLPLLAMITVDNRLLLSLDRERDFILVSGCALGTNVGLNLLLIPRWGHQGAALASVVSLLVARVIYFRLVRRAGLEMPWARSKALTVGALAVSWAASLILLRLVQPAWVSGWTTAAAGGWPALFAAGGMTCVFYFGLLSLLRIMQWEEWRRSD